MSRDDYQDRWDEARHYSERYGYPVTPQILVNHFHAQELANQDRSFPIFNPRSGMAELRAASLAKQFQLNPP